MNSILPPNWAWVKLGDVCSTTSGGTPSRGNSKFYDGDIPWVKSGELDKGLILDTEEKISDEALKNSSAKIFPKGTLLIALYGATIGKLAFLGIDAATNQAVCGIYKNVNIDSNFLFNFLFFKKAYLVKQSIGGAQPNISQGILKNLEIPLPPLPEQKKIVEKIEELFSGLDSGVASLKKAKEQIRLFKQSVLVSAFNGKLSGKGNVDEKTGLPEGWKLLPLKNIVVSDRGGLKRGPFGSSIKKSFFVESGYKVYEQGNAINDDPYRGKYYINEEKFKELESFKVIPGDLIVSCSGVTLGRITEIPIDALHGIINQALLRIRLNKKIISNKYFIIMFRSHFFQKRIFLESQGTAMPNLVGLKYLKEINIIIPPLSQQIQIVEEIEKRFSEADNLEKAIDESLVKSETLRQSILKQAFEGRLV
jgi:type I restriction enzyme S subunit